VYPIVVLRWPLRRYIDALENAVIAALERYGIEAGKNPGHRGVWIGGRKIASLGIAVEDNTAYHGVAVNVSIDVAEFARVNPCGLPASLMTSMRLLGVDADVKDVGIQTALGLAKELGLSAEISDEVPDVPLLPVELRPVQVQEAGPPHER
jgi:lipoyl(octanoyl) transferase